MTNQEEAVGEGPMDICLVCCSKVNLEIKLSVGNERGMNHQLGKNLRVIFLLRNLLQVPEDQVEGNLRVYGNPENWIRLCEQCSELTRKGEELYRQIRKIDKELRSIRNVIVNQIRSGHDDDDDDGNDELNKKTGDPDVMKHENKWKRNVWRRTREFVTTYDYKTSTDVDNPFPEGDKRAETMVNQLQKPISVFNPGGNHGNSDDDTDDDALSVCIKQESDENEGSDDMEDGQDDDHDWEPETETVKKLPSFRRPLFTSTIRKRTPRPPIIIDGKYKCHHCDKLFNSRQMCHKHEQKMHFSLTPGQYPCDICGKLNNSLSFLTEHKRSAHKIKADGTPVTTIRPRKTNRNRRPSIIIDGKYKCHHCDQLFNGRQMCHKHEQRMHLSHPPESNGTRFPSTLRRNRPAVLLDGKHKCHHCDKVFNSRQTCHKHQRIHKIKKDDDDDPNATKTEGPWKQIVKKDDKWTCLHCDKKYMTKLSCYIHVVEKHERTPGHFVCDICGISWNNQGYLNIHKRKVHKVSVNGTPVLPSLRKPKGVDDILKEPQTCEICWKTYATKVSLQNHVRFVHEKRFKCYCHLCGMGFYSSPAMQRHLLSMHKEDKQIKRMMEEEGARIWSCEVVGCCAKFVKEKGLEEHTNKYHSSSTNEEDNDKMDGKRFKYTCSFCGKGFWRPGQLKEHELIHKNAEEKPYSCDICGVKMATSNYLRNHRRRVHKIYKQIVE